MRVSISSLECGGQGRNRTADASLFREFIFESYLPEIQDLLPSQPPISRLFIGTKRNNFLIHPCRHRKPPQTLNHAALRLWNELLINIERRTRAAVAHQRLSVLHIGPSKLEPCCEGTPQHLPVDPRNPELPSRRLEVTPQNITILDWTTL